MKKLGLTPDSALRLHLGKARDFWREDRLDLACAAMQEALKVGIPPGDLYDFQRTVEAEWAARRASIREQLSDHLILEADPEAWVEMLPDIRRIAREALEDIEAALGVEWSKPVLLALFTSDEWLQFMHARYGYYAERTECHKICLPPAAIRSLHIFARATRHEMGHAAAHELAGESIPRWLDEGIAVHLEGGAGSEESRLLRSLERKPRLDSISAAFESYRVDLGTGESRAAYAAAGDFISALDARAGMAGIRRLLAGIRRTGRADKATRAAFGVPLDELEREWREGSAAKREAMKLIVGLGNPGAEYEGTRHNVGFEAIEELSSRHRIPVRGRTLHSVMGDGVIGGRHVILARPMTYMNLSGEAVAAIARKYRIPPEDVLIIVDDAAIPVGKIRLRPKGSAGGHNGLKSIEQHLGTRDYPRIRIGVGAASGGAMIDHVLGRFRQDERQAVSESIDQTADAVEVTLRDGFEKAMNRYNREPGKENHPSGE